uniref:Putative aminopeptidase (inferred by orthology to a C. elegans protein) n=1 Tax=Strongyloides venezuelensis TaxID=75913 RepID=A0A0K0FLB9_STRVS
MVGLLRRFLSISSNYCSLQINGTRMLSAKSLLSTQLSQGNEINDPKYDGVIIVSHSFKEVSKFPKLAALAKPIEDFSQYHTGFEKSQANLIVVDKQIIPSGRLIYSATGSVSKDFEDVRKFKVAGSNAIKLAMDSGMKKPLFTTIPYDGFPRAEIISALGAINGLYTPLNIRDVEENNYKAKLEELSLLGNKQLTTEQLHNIVMAYGYSMSVCNDIGDSDPQRMTPAKVAEYIQNLFGGCDSAVKVKVESDMETIKKNYPCMAAVNRCANDVPEHRARLIWLEYDNNEPNGQGKETLMFVGKGVTIDTGGLNIKTGTNMKGMCRDKTGAANVAGFFSALNLLRPKNIKVVGYMCMVRNSVGSNAYSTDEILTARSGKRIHIYNTDAEGRLAMLDPLTEMREKAINEVNPHIFTFATLTGHELMCYGEYAAAMDNGPAAKSGASRKLQETGDEYGQPLEISRIQPEDFTTHDSEFEGADICQLSTKHSPKRGHQGAACFLMRGSLIVDHGSTDNQPLKYTHVDLAGPNGNYPKNSYPNPLVTLIGHYIIPRSG